MERNNFGPEGYLPTTDAADVDKTETYVDKKSTQVSAESSAEERNLDQELRHLRTDIDKLMVEVELSRYAIKASHYKKTNMISETQKTDQKNNTDRKKIRTKGRKYSEETADIFIVELDQLLDDADMQ